MRIVLAKFFCFVLNESFTLGGAMVSTGHWTLCGRVWVDRMAQSKSDQNISAESNYAPAMAA